MDYHNLSKKETALVFKNIVEELAGSLIVLISR